MMKKSLLLFLIAMMFLLNSCDIIGGIFEAGVWVGVFIVIAIIFLIIFVLVKIFKS